MSEKNFKKIIIVFFCFVLLVVFVVFFLPKQISRDYSGKLIPVEGIYHAGNPNFGGWSNEVSGEEVYALEKLVGKNLAWVKFSNPWFRPNEKLNCTEEIFSNDQGIHFPKEQVKILKQIGKVPFIKMLPFNRCIDLDYEPYKLQRFLDGDHDEDIRKWARQAKKSKTELLLSFGSEMNGYWFPWNNKHNGGSSKSQYGDPLLYDGQERFRDTYRHIINIFREEEVDNVTWFFHVNCFWGKEEPGNDIEGYYPGDEYIDWIGVSCYGSQSPEYPEWWDLELTFDSLYQVIENSEIISADKPIALVEFGVAEHPRKVEWINNAFNDFINDRYSRLKAIGWWHSNFCLDYVYDENEQQEENCRLWSQVNIDSSEEALQTYKNYIQEEIFLEEPYFLRKGD